MAQWIARLTSDQAVVGSSPTRVDLPPWRNWIAHRTSNPGVAGSNPAGGVFFN